MLDVLATLAAALRLDPVFFSNLDAVSIWIVLGVALLAGISTMLGHVAILALNRISGFHVITSLFFGAVLLALLHMSQAAVTWAVTSLTLWRPLPLVNLLMVAMLSLAPLVLNFVTALPHLGLGIGRVLEAWSFLIFWFGVAHAFRFTWYWALVFTICGWLAMQLLSRLLHRPLSWMLSRGWKLATGRPTMVTSRDILAGMPIIPIDTKRVSREATS